MMQVIANFYGQMNKENLLFQLSQLGAEGKNIQGIQNEVFEEIKKEIEEKIDEERKIPITREAFLTEMENAIEQFRNVGLSAQLKIRELENTKNRLLDAEEMGMRVKFWTDEKGVFFEAIPKEPAGFKK